MAGLSTGVVLPFFSQINTQHHVAESFDIKRDFKKIKRRFADQPELEMMVYLTNAFDRALFLKDQALETKVIKSSANIQKEY
ncbi:MAG: hypothetical protein CL674_10985 [Bdellovibrionaceae bacterium]|nr:hypothetical protein [Pseudobdellovibrionaceae bacterium]